MTVAELVAKLQGMDQSLPVMVDNADMPEYVPADRCDMVRVREAHPGFYEGARDGELSVVVIS